jgi:3-oxoacyl-[acyl-carrier protein] reductase
MREKPVDVKGKVALVTGSATGLGREILLSLARAGAAVIVNYSRSENDAKKTAEDARALGATVQVVKADVSDESQVLEMVVRAAREFGRIDILVNNAGTTRFIPFPDLDALTPDVWNSIMGVNLMGTFYCSRAVGKLMMANGFGRIVNMASVAGITGQSSSMPYSVSKAGVISLTKTFARALAPTVTVNAVAPGVTDTRWIAGRAEFRAAAAERNLFGRVATPADVAQVAMGLITNEGFITGQVVIVDGGLTM